MNPLYQNGVASALPSVGEDAKVKGVRAVNPAAASLGALAAQPSVVVDAARLLPAAPAQFCPASLAGVGAAGSAASAPQRAVVHSNGHNGTSGVVMAQAVPTQSPLPQQVLSPGAAVLMAQQAPSSPQAQAAAAAAAARPNGNGGANGGTNGGTNGGANGGAIPPAVAKPPNGKARGKGGKGSPGLNASPPLVVTNDGAILLQQTVPLPSSSVSALAAAAPQGSPAATPPASLAASTAPLPQAAPMMDSSGNVRQVLMMMSGSQRLALLPVVRPDKVLPGPDRVQPVPPAALQGLSLPAGVMAARAGGWMPATQVEVLCAVECQTRGGWAEATVVRTEPDGRVRVRLTADAAEERLVPGEHVRDPPPCETNFVCAVGQIVEMRWHALWCEGEIVELRLPQPLAPEVAAAGIAPNPDAAVQVRVRLAPNGELVWCEQTALRRRLPGYVAGPPPLALPMASSSRGPSPGKAPARAASPFAVPMLPEGAKPSPTSAGESPHGDFAFKRPRAPSSRERSPKRRPPAGDASGLVDDFALSVSTPGKFPSIVVPSPRGTITPESSPVPPSTVSSAKRTLSAEPQVATGSRGANGQEFVRITVPQGVSGGQTLLLSVQRPNEQMELVLPAGVAAGDKVLAHTSGGDAVHVPVPAGAVAGQRLLLSVPLPPQSLCVCLPSAAQPGRQVQFPLPAPSGDHDGDHSLPGRARDRSRERSKHRSPRVETPPETWGGSGVPLLPKKSSRDRRPSSHASSPSEAPSEHEQWLSAVRNFDSEIDARREQPKALAQLRGMPEMVETWLLCQVLRPRLQLPQLSLEQLERCLTHSLRAAELALAGGGSSSEAAASPPGGTDDASQQPSDSLLLSELHCRLLEGLRAAKVPTADGVISPPATPPAPLPQLARDGNWPHMLYVALHSGLWARAHPEAPMPMWRPTTAEGAASSGGKRPQRIGGKFGQWVTERGPTLCGTFGCILPNNHSGLHQLPEDAGSRQQRGARSKRKQALLPGEEEEEEEEAPSVVCMPVSPPPPPGVGLTVQSPASLTVQSPASKEPNSPAGGRDSPATQESVTAAAIASLKATAGGGADAMSGPESMALYAGVVASERLLMLRCLCRALMSGGERQALQRTVASCHIGSDTEGTYWLLPAEHRLYRAPLGLSGGQGALPLGCRWQSLAVARHELLRFAQLLDRAGSAVAAPGSALSAGALGARTVLDAMRPLFEPHELVLPSPPAAVATAVARHSGGGGGAPPSKRACGGIGHAAAAGSRAGASALGAAGGGGLVAAGSGAAAFDGGGSEACGPVHVKASLRACKVPVGHRQLSVRAVLKLSIPRQRRVSSTMRWRREETGAEGGAAGGEGGDGYEGGGARARGGHAGGANGTNGTGGAGSSKARRKANGYEDEGDTEQELFEVEEILQRRIAHGGEPQFLVKWKGFGHNDDSWEPWTSLIAPCAVMLRDFHVSQMASGALRPYWADACPASTQADTELPHWRVQAKRTSSGREYRVFFGPLGEHVRSRVTAQQLASLYTVPEEWRRGGAGNGLPAGYMEPTAAGT